MNVTALDHILNIYIMHALKGDNINRVRGITCPVNINGNDSTSVDVARKYKAVNCLLSSILIVEEA